MLLRARRIGKVLAQIAILEVKGHVESCDALEDDSDGDSSSTTEVIDNEEGTS